MDFLFTFTVHAGLPSCAHRPRYTIGWLLTVFLLIGGLSGCKKKAPANGDTGTSAPAIASGGGSSAGATPGGGSVTPNAADQPGSLAARLNAIQAGPAPDDAAKIRLPTWKPVSAATSSMQIPLVSGLAIDGAISNDRFGDLETKRTLGDITAQTITATISGETITKMPPPGTTVGLKTKPVSATRIDDVADWTTAHRLMDLYKDKATEHYPGSTSWTASKDVLAQLHAGLTVDFSYEHDPQEMLSAVLTGHPTLSEASTRWGMYFMYKCPLQRVEPTDLSMPVMVNDVRVELPVIHAKCDLSSEEVSNFYILDQPSNPILLASQIAPSQDRFQIIKITWLQRDGDVPAASMEKQLAEKQPVQIYGIYFDFSSDVLKPESEIVLKQISDILQKNPDWKLNVNGHTDNVGGDSFNMDLSKRRAAAVKAALVTRYKIAPDRLATNGYGATKPIEPNTTLEGRARNRRVELQRQ